MSLAHHFARQAHLIGHPSRALMLDALMGQAEMSVTALAEVAGISVQTASVHLGKLAAGGLLRVRRQGRQRYYALHGPEVAAILRQLAGLSAPRPVFRMQTLQALRVCYGHLAGRVGVALTEAWQAAGLLVLDEVAQTARITAAAWPWLTELGINIADRPQHTELCLDWTERRWHVAGWLGHELLAALVAQGYVQAAAHEPRALRLSARGRRYLRQWLPEAVALPD